MLFADTFNFSGEYEVAVIAGLSIAAILAVVAWARGKVVPPKVEAKPELRVGVTIEAKEELKYSSHPNPHEIMQALDAATPFARKDLAAHYKGIPVRWEAKFVSISHPSEFGSKEPIYLVTLHFQYGEKDWENRQFYCYVDINKTPFLKVAQKGEKLVVAGKLQVSNSVDLYDVSEIHPLG